MGVSQSRSALGGGGFTAVVAKKLNLIERVVYSCVTIGSAVCNATFYDSRRSLADSDYEILIWNGQAVTSLLGLLELFGHLF